MQFPEGFVEKYEAILEDEARDFLASFKQEAVSAFRVNPLKESQLSFA
ncbi:MAG: 23S rRNA methyltransferase, partial [Streptococcus sp.]